MSGNSLKKLLQVSWISNIYALLWDALRSRGLLEQLYFQATNDGSGNPQYFTMYLCIVYSEQNIVVLLL